MSLNTSIQADQLTPHNTEAEEAVIGSILINPAAIADVDGLVPGEFYIDRYATIFDAMVRLDRRGEAIDFLTVGNELETMGKIQDVGGRSTLLSLINNTPSALNVESYVAIVREMALRRHLLLAASEIARVVHSNETEIEAVVEKATAAFNGAVSTALTSATIVSVEDSLRAVDADVMLAYKTRKENPGSVPMLGLRSMLPDVDIVTRGIKPGELEYVAGRPGTGKSSYMLGQARAAAEGGHPVGLIGLEMPHRHYAARLILPDVGLSFAQVTEGRIPDDKLEAYNNALATVGNLPIHISDDVRFGTPQGIRMIARRMVHEFHIEALFIDYIQLIRVPSNRNMTRNDEVSTISREMKLLAMELGIPVVAGSQLSRAVEQRSDSRPKLSDLRESGSLEQDADVVKFLWHDDEIESDNDAYSTTSVIIAKNRNGGIGSVDAMYELRTMRFLPAVRTTVDLDGPALPEPDVPDFVMGRDHD